jgi:5S rRNA maturation endonuclease (ribonuclease M5)
MDLKSEILAHLDVRALYHKELGELKNGRGDQALGLCPFHEDTRASLSLNLKNGLWNCKACSAKGDVFTFIRKKYGTDFRGALHLLAKEAGIEIGRGNGRRGKKAGKATAQIVKTHDYHDEDGVLVFQVCRTHPKGFFQRRPDGKGGWVNNLDGVPLVPYRLPMVLKAQQVFIAEGEKDCDALAELGLTCTCNPQGAGKWRAEYNEHFADKQVIIIPDNDDPGRKHAQDVARHLHGVAASVKAVELPDLPEKGDICDWLQRGGTKEELLALADSTPEWNASADQQPITSEKDGKPAQSELLIALAADAEFFHTPDKTAYVTTPVDDHRETWPVGSKGFRLWLRGRFYKTFNNKAPSAQALQDALGVLESRALFDGLELSVHVRMAHTPEAVFVDLGTPTWEAVEITAQGWQVVTDPPVKFRRPAGLAPLPAPERGGTLEALCPFFNIRSDDWPLIAAWLTACFSPGPYPILVTQGEQGSSKSTLCRMLRALIDPNTSPLRSLPREERDLAIAAQNCWLPAFDNVSVVPEWLSDGFCRLSTGGGLATRTLYTNSDETLFNSMRPLLLNGIRGLVHRQDLARRSIILELPAISEAKRRPEASLWTMFEEVRASILGALYDAVATALANHSKVNLPSHPAMADFATWAVAAESALGIDPGGFLAAYRGNISEVVERSLAADPVASAVQKLMAEQERWVGTPTELLDALEGLVPERTAKMKTWPKAPHVLTNRLKRAATFLRAAGIEIEISKSGNRKILIDRLGSEKSVRSVHSAQDQEESENPPDASMDASPGLDAPGVHTDASQNEASREKDRKFYEMDAQDASDAKIPIHSMSEEDDFLEGEI